MGDNKAVKLAKQQLDAIRNFLAPYQNALDLPKLQSIIESGGQGGAVLPMDTAVSMAKNEAATAGLNEAEAAQRTMGQRTGASVFSGPAQAPVAAYQDKIAQNIALAGTQAAGQQQQLQLGQQSDILHTLSGVINTLFGGYGGVSESGVGNANYNWLTGTSGLIPGVAAAAGAYGHSDRRLKTNIEKVGKFGPLRVYEYDIDDHRERGVIAQEARVLFPEVVHEDPKGLMVNYKRLVELVAQNA